MPEQIKIPEQAKIPEQKSETEKGGHFAQRKRPELGRFLLQVDRQTKSAYQTAETAHSAGSVIKNEYPILQVTVYDSVECASTIVELQAPTSAAE
jgi:hypothetical protein